MEEINMWHYKGVKETRVGLKAVVSSFALLALVFLIFLLWMLWGLGQISLLAKQAPLYCGH